MARTLKINVRPRRTSERVKSRSTSYASAASPATSGTSSVGDTIEVAVKSSDGPERSGDAASENAAGDASQIVANGPDESMIGVAATSEDMPTKSNKGKTSTVGISAPSANRKDDRKTIDEPAQKMAENDDVEMADEDDRVTEYDFSKEHDSVVDDEDDNPRGIFKDDANDVITISSDDDGEGAQETFAANPRPWLQYKNNDHDSYKYRADRERMYALQRTQPYNGSWEWTETFQEQMDVEMEEYIKDFPLPTWVIGLPEASAAYDRMSYRKRMRSFGVPIFQQQHLVEMSRQPGPGLQMSVPSHQGNYGPPGHHQMPMPQQQQLAHHHMPPPHMMHYGGMGYGPPPSPFLPQPMLPSNQPMQQVGVDQNGQPLYQPVPLQHHQPAPMAPPGRSSSYSQMPEQRNSSSKGGASAPNAYLPQVRTKPPPRRKTLQPPTSVDAPAPTDPALTPPYPTRDVPAGNPKVWVGFQYKRRPEPEVYPWNRKMDFEAAKAAATWDRKFILQSTLDAMEKIRAVNAVYMKDVDDEDKKKLKGEVDADGKPMRRRKEPKNTNTDDSDDGVVVDYRSFGNFCYGSKLDQLKAKSIAGNNDEVPKDPTVEDLMQAGENGHVDMPTLGAIEICWNAGKKGLTQDLKQIRFSVADSVRTRGQLANTPILTRDAAECIIDFCPDLLWRDIVLRITTETPIGPKELRNRMCLNGVWMDQATSTGRVRAALGKKQYQAHRKRSMAGEGAAASPANNEDQKRYYLENSKDYDNYGAFFGNALRKPWTDMSGKARRGILDTDSSAADSRPTSSGSDASVMVVRAKPDAGVAGAAEGGQKSVAKRDKGKGKANAAFGRGLDGAGDDDDAVAIDIGGVEVIETGIKKGKELDEVSEQSDGELDRLLENDDED